MREKYQILRVPGLKIFSVDGAVRPLNCAQCACPQPIVGIFRPPGLQYITVAAKLCNNLGIDEVNHREAWGNLT